MKKEKTYTKKEIEEMLWIPCCHITGMHNPTHYRERKYICNDQKVEALERFCKKIGINPQTKSKLDCGWCYEEYGKKPTHELKGEGLKLFKKN